MPVLTNPAEAGWQRICELGSWVLWHKFTNHYGYVRVAARCYERDRAKRSYDLSWDSNNQRMCRNADADRLQISEPALWQQILVHLNRWKPPQ